LEKGQNKQETPYESDGHGNSLGRTQLKHAKEQVMEQLKNKEEVKPQQPRNLTTGVLVLLTAKPGVTREQIMKIMPAEIRATVQLYLDGAIQQWYARGDGRGAVFIMDCKDVTEAEAVIDRLPLSGKNLLDHSENLAHGAIQNPH
jgi:hypothetical protein